MFLNEQTCWLKDLDIKYVDLCFDITPFADGDGFWFCLYGI